MAFQAIELGPNQAVHIVLDNREQLLRFLAAYAESEISSVTALVILPVRARNGTVTVQLVPGAKDPSDLILGLINASLTDGLLAEFGQFGRATVQTRLFELADRAKF